MTKLSYLVKQALRHYKLVVAFAVGVFLTVIPSFWLQESELAEPLSPAVPAVVEESPASLARSAPILLRIPRIDVATSFAGALGLNDDNTVEVPSSYEEVGWYKYGPTPGEIGPAVVLGHVDSYQGPAVFYRLGQLEAGDLIYVDRADGSTVTFRVTSLERHPQSDFPTAKVYSDIPYAGLRLITCTGTYDRNVLRYTHNLVVFAELVDEEE